MRVDITFDCMGCDQAYRVVAHVTSADVRSGSILEWIAPKLPHGWVADDPYTGSRYCPTCWEEIENGGSEKEKADAES